MFSEMLYLSGAAAVVSSRALRLILMDNVARQRVAARTPAADQDRGVAREILTAAVDD